jgi:O-glycosyl hydrolase
MFASRFSNRVLRVCTAIACAALIAGISGQESGPLRITVDLSKRYQTIDGFGVNFNGTYFREAQKSMIDMLIDDLGATIFRLDPYGLTNWEAQNDNDDPKQMNWEYYNDRYSIPTFEASWAAGRYLNSRGIKPFMALSGIAPEWMLDKKPLTAEPENHKRDLSRPYHLNPAMYEEFAEEVVSMAMYARTKARINFTYFGPLNETDCYPAEGPRIDPVEAPRVFNAISHRLRQEGLGDVRLVVAEQCNLDSNYVGPILDSPDLMRQVGVFGFHSYGNASLTPHIQRLDATRYRNTVRVWLTEYGDLNDLDQTAANEWTNFSVAATSRALRALNEGASAALFWDAYDNYHEHYPRFTHYGLVRNSDHMYMPKKRYYAAKQLYHFVRPGSQRVDAVSSDPRGLLVSAFHDPSRGEFILVGLKEGGPEQIEIHFGDQTPPSGHLEVYQTTRMLDCQKTGEVLLTGAVAHLQIPADSIFTIVGKIDR